MLTRSNRGVIPSECVATSNLRNLGRVKNITHSSPDQFLGFRRSIEFSIPQLWLIAVHLSRFHSKIHWNIIRCWQTSIASTITTPTTWSKPSFHIGRCSTTLLGPGTATAQHFAILRCWGVAKFCPSVMKLLPTCCQLVVELLASRLLVVLPTWLLATCCQRCSCIVEYGLYRPIDMNVQRTTYLQNNCRYGKCLSSYCNLVS